RSSRTSGRGGRSGDGAGGNCRRAPARRLLFPAREAGSSGLLAARGGGTHRDRHRLQPRLLAAHFAASCHEHGLHAVRPDAGRGACRGDPRGGGRAGPVGRDRHDRARQARRIRGVGRRAPGRTRLPHGLQPAPSQDRRSMTVILRPGSVPLADLETIYRTGATARLHDDFRAGVASAAARIAEIAGGPPVYGVNTGFGKLASVRIAPSDTETLQRNLILSHCCGVGAPLAPEIVRLVMALKLVSVGRGASGVRPETVALIEAMLERGVVPVIPEKGSVGASGDLAPLAHMTAVMIGEGEAMLDGETMPTRAALARVGIEPIRLAAKEGLALINGTQVSTALALAGLFRAHRAANAALVTGALSTDAAMGSSAPFHPEIHRLRGHCGQIDTAAALWRLLEGSEIRDSHLEGDERVQDPYCIRCQPQVDGACLDLLRMAARTLGIEANAVTDTPRVLADGSVVSGGNFHAEPVAFAADQIALAVCEIG